MRNRTEYIEWLAGKLHEWDERIDELRARAEVSGAGVRDELRAHIAELREKRERAATLLDELHEAGDSAWKDVRKRADGLYEEVKAVFRKAA